MRIVVFGVSISLNKICPPDKFCPHSLMDKTRGFYPLDLGSTPSGDTRNKCQVLCLVFIMGFGVEKLLRYFVSEAKQNTQKVYRICRIRLLVGTQNKGIVWCLCFVYPRKTSACLSSRSRSSAVYVFSLLLVRKHASCRPEVLVLWSGANRILRTSGTTPSGDTALRKTKTSFCFLAVSAANMFLFPFLEIKTIEAGLRVLSKISTKYLFWLVTRDHCNKTQLYALFYCGLWGRKAFESDYEQSDII